MPRYSSQQLTLMAAIVAADDAQGGERSMRLYVAIAIRVGMDPRDVRQRIMEMASA